MDASMLLAGPRGRRLLLLFALGADDALNEPLRQHVFTADLMLDPHPPVLLTMTADDMELPNDTRGTYAYMPVPEVGFEQRERKSAPDPDAVSDAVRQAVAALESAVLSDVNWETLAPALGDAVSLARYWQPPDGTDVLLARDEMQRPLARIAEHIVASHDVGWWMSSLEERAQHAMLWDGQDPVTPVDRARRQLLDARRHLEEQETRARDEKWGGKVSAEWWSAPSWPVTGPHTTRLAPDDSPVGALLVEDDFGWEEGESIELAVPEGLQVFEIHSVDAWVDLCRRFPIEVTEQKRGDWFDATGREGVWVIPDWAAVSEEYDGVHLQVAAYLQAAGRALPVTDEAATVLAGWDPDATYWFTSRVRYVGERVRWVSRDDDDRLRWQRAEE